MYIDITGPPPADLARTKKRLLRIILILFGMVICAVLIGIVRVVYDTGRDTILENVAIALFVGAGFAFVYFTEKLHAYKPLTMEQQGKIEGLCRQYPEIAAYCGRLEGGRNLIAAEYEAFTAHADKVEGTKDKKGGSSHTSSPAG